MKETTCFDFVEAIDELDRSRTWLHAAWMAISGMTASEDTNALLELNELCRVHMFRVLDMLNAANDERAALVAMDVGSKR